MIFRPGVMGNGGIIPSRILFKTDFTNSTLAAYTTVGASAWSYMTGTNNGYEWPYVGGSNQLLDSIKVGAQLINDYGNVTTVNAATFGSVTISGVTDLPGYVGNSLDLEVIDTGFIYTGTDEPWGGQNDFIFQRISSPAPSPLPDDLEDLYCKYYIKLPDSLRAAIIAGGAGISRTAIFEMKAGGYADLYGGDCRINFGIQKNVGGDFEWDTYCDQGANGSMTSSADLATKWDRDLVFWDAQSSAIAPVWDAWVKFEISFHRHATAGTVKVAINDVLVCDESNVRTLGVYSLPVGRIIATMAYSGTGPVSAKICDLEIRDFPPVGSALT